MWNTFQHIKFEEVIKVQSKNINQKNKNKPLEYLAIKSSLFLDNIFKIKIFFSGGGVITIISEVIEVTMKDLGKPWNVKYFPAHKIWILNYFLIFNKIGDGEVI